MIRRFIESFKKPRHRDADACPVCGGREFRQKPILWPELIAEWELTPVEAEQMDCQQGWGCRSCKCSLRAMTLAHGIMETLGWPGLFDALCQPGTLLSRMDVLEINEASQLSTHLSRLPRRILATYPAIDMQAMPYPDASYDLVIHSDTLEHTPEPLSALRECHRVLRHGGCLAYTVPIVTGRPTRSRAGLPPSFHGLASEPCRDDYRVHSEYGADAWCETMRAGFTEVRIATLRFPESVALIARKGTPFRFSPP